jgi:hypothetical protein
LAIAFMYFWVYINYICKTMPIRYICYDFYTYTLAGLKPGSFANSGSLHMYVMVSSLNA